MAYPPSSGPESQALKYVHSFEKMLCKCIATGEEYLLFTESDQNFLVTPPHLGKNESVSQEVEGGSLICRQNVDL